MKKTLRTFSLLLLLSLAFTSCKKDDDDTQNNVSTNKITLSIDNGTEIVYTDVTGVALADKLTIGASNSNSDIQIIVDSDISQGTYTSPTQIGMSHGVHSQAVFTSATNTTSLSFEVTSHDTAAKHIKGSFSLSYNDNHDNTIQHNATGTYDVTYH